jgi:hypothetical protein
MPGKFWWVYLQMIDSNHLWCSSLLLKNWNFVSAISFTRTYPVSYCHRWVGAPNLFPFQRENRRVSIGYVKPLAAWLADGSCKQLKELGFGPHTIAWFSINLQRTVQKP